MDTIVGDSAHAVIHAYLLSIGRRFLYLWFVGYILDLYRRDELFRVPGNLTALALGTWLAALVSPLDWCCSALLQSWGDWIALAILSWASVSFMNSNNSI